MCDFFYPTDLVHTTPPANDVCDWTNPWSVLGFLSRRYCQWKELEFSDSVQFRSQLPDLLAAQRDNIQLVWQKMMEEGVKGPGRP